MMSSNRVKLNRTRVKDVTCLNLVTRRRVQPEQNFPRFLSEYERDRTLIMEPSTGREKPDATASSARGLWVNGRSRGDPGACLGMSVSLIPRRRRVFMTDFDGNVNPISTSLTGSEGSLRRIVQTSGCGRCSDCKLISPQRRTLAKQVEKNIDHCPEHHKATQALKEDLYPKVNLCDVVLNADASCHDCGFVLPNVLKTETVHCFKQDMIAAGFQLRPCCSGHHKNGSEEDQNVISGPRLQLYEDGDNLINPTTRPFFKGCKNDYVSATWSASTLTGNPTGEHGVESDPRKECDATLTEIHGDKINNIDYIKTDTLKLIPDLEIMKHNRFLNEEEKSCRTLNNHSQSLAELKVWTCNTFSVKVKDNCVPEESCEVRDGAQTPEETSGLFDDDPASFSCQRVRVHFKEKKDSCARTYITWHSKWQIVNGLINLENYTNDLAQTDVMPSAPLASVEPSSSGRSGDLNDSYDTGRLEGTDEEVNEVQVKSDQQVEQTTSLDGSAVLAKATSSPSTLDDDGEACNCEGPPSSASEPGSSSSELADDDDDNDDDGCPSKSGAGGDAHLCILDEFTAYQRDILLVNVNQDDSDLFGNLPQESLLKLGPNRVHEDPKTLVTYGVSQTLKPSLTPVNINLQCTSPDDEENSGRPWRPKKGSSSPKSQSNIFMGKSNASSNTSRGFLERHVHIQAVNELHNSVPSPWTVRNGPSMPNPANNTEPRCQKFNSYCRLFFSESQSCGYKKCRFLHVPMEGDEKFCVNTVACFTKNPMCLQKAGALFTSYYQNNPPGTFFSMPVFLSLLWALLKAGIMCDVLSVLGVSLAHKIVPTHEFLLALFTFVRVKGFISVVPCLIQLTYKMANENLMLSVGCFDCVKNTPEFQKIIHANMPAKQSLPISDSLYLAHVIVEIELCAKQEDWRLMGEAFRSICTPSQHPGQLERLSGQIAVALLSESKDTLSVPFEPFAQTICHNEDPNSLLISFFGRIGVSLMLRYHKTQQWAKGRRVVEVLSQSKVNYSMLKGLFGNEDRGSRCHLITVAAEHFLFSGSLEGALKTLQENKWFVSSSAWPSQHSDLESRSRVLMHLAAKASHRDALEVLCNLPGIQEPNDQVDITKYIPLFNAHLQVCVDRMMLPVASNTVDFMLSRKLPVEGAVLQTLLHRLGKQNHWLRAREVFRHSLTAGYYPAVSAPAGSMALIVPSRLGEVELALTFEMLITVNASHILPLSETTTSSVSITLKRSQESEREYLSAGSRLLSAALIPQPKLVVHYTTVNSSQEQVFTLCIVSARCWLRSNLIWANELWNT
ncbi:uncharacterized protein topaz1 isoform X2 [Phyllopteryx taeniolatus]|uniref:uncharacterized protein topaz1 isoform X2 n=1 Tax=Phyllopteryx taeniolatus TaxID=161469 RepID=UPI002AD5A46B|nr:uncharacterized protein topaz1 isoform X2 [Phyllopteryx taeniolatus]